MESLGEKLQTTRESKEISLDQASRETNIAVRFLEALETEKFSGFPGEPYIIGFLKNYGSYLDLNVQDLLSLYRAYKIQEQPVPVEQLLKAPSKKPKVLAAVIAVFILMASGGGVAFFLTRPAGPAVSAPVVRAPAEHVMSGDSLERRLYKGDTVLVPVDASQYKLELVNLGDAITIKTPQRDVILDLSQEVNEDINGDGIIDLRITAADFSKNNADMGVLLRLNISNAPPPAAVIPVAADAPAVEAVTAVRLAGTTVVFDPSQAGNLANTAYPFTLQSNFQGYCMLRWEILRERDRRGTTERYFQRSDEPLSIQANNGIRVWVSNAQAAKFQVIVGGRTIPLELGAAGEVVVADITWVQDENKRYRLVLARLEAGNA